jgi:predicted nucleic acid-binding protein
MLAYHFTALIDACVLAGALKRNLILSLAAEGFFRVRWSQRILDETEAAITKQLAQRGDLGAEGRARLAIDAICLAFGDGIVGDYEGLTPTGLNLPDANDRHVIDAAIKAGAHVIVTDNLRDFPPEALGALGLEVRSTDAFLADTIDLDAGRAVAALFAMRLRFNRPTLTADALLSKMEGQGLFQTCDSLRDFVQSL